MRGRDEMRWGSGQACVLLEVIFFAAESGKEKRARFLRKGEGWKGELDPGAEISVLITE